MTLHLVAMEKIVRVILERMRYVSQGMEMEQKFYAHVSNMFSTMWGKVAFNF